jgi:hypothetical protein
MERVCKILNEVRLSSMFEIGSWIGVSYETRTLIEDLNMQQISVKFMPRLLTNEQKQWHVFVCQQLLDEDKNDQNFLLRVIIGDKTWLYCYDPEPKRQSSQAVIFRTFLKFSNNCYLSYT